MEPYDCWNRCLCNIKICVYKIRFVGLFGLFPESLQDKCEHSMKQRFIVEARSNHPSNTNTSEYMLSVFWNQDLLSLFSHGNEHIEWSIPFIFFSMKDQWNAAMLLSVTFFRLYILKQSQEYKLEIMKYYTILSLLTKFIKT